MKKQIAFIVSIILIVSLTACGKENAPSMKLTKAELTTQEENIIELLKFDNSANIYDFVVDETIKTVSVNSYELNKNGDWQRISGGGDAVVGISGRIALSFDIVANGMRVAMQDESGTTSTKNTIPETLDTSGLSIATSFANGTTEIVYEKELPLVVQIVTSKDEVTSYDVDYFSKPQKYQKLGYEHVYAITVTFSQNPLS